MNARTKTPPPDGMAPASDWPERNQQWLVAAIGRLRARLQSFAAQSGSDAVRDYVESGDAADFVPALLQCAETFRLSPFERELLLLVAGLELDEGLRSAVAALNGGASNRASFGLGFRALTAAHWDALSPDAPLRHWRMIEPETGAPLALAPLRMDERILHFIGGVPATDSRLSAIARVVQPHVRTPVAPEVAIAGEIARALSSDIQSRIVAVQSERGDTVALRDCAFAALAHIAQSGLWIAAQDLPADPGEMDTIALHVDREAALTGAVPVLCVDEASERLAVNFTARLRGALLWLGQPAPVLAALPHGPRIVRFTLPSPDAAHARGVLLARWNELSSNADGAEDVRVALGRAAMQFHLGPAATDDVVERLLASPPPERAAAAWPLAREAARGGLDALAQRIVTRLDFDDLVLPPAHLATLRDMARHLQHRERVYQDWGFGEKHARGQGMTALFAGESGTGKTLAAEVIANEVGLDLYRVDLATLVSKYIGETEKNLKRLFDAAESSGAVLLFDEADALFGKRSEVKDSHDRYANIEVAYLLQRVEAYRGLAILTTNMKSALDRAFLRRIRFVVNFPFPDAAAREQIWRRQFPPRAPLGDVDFKALARLSLPGGHIHSIALNAAFKAADGGSPIDQSVLMSAARAEFAKLERSMGDAATRGAG